MRYDVARVQVMPKEERRTQWKFRDKYLAGVEHVYTVLDGNFKGANRWEFLVRVPDATRQPGQSRYDNVPDGCAPRECLRKPRLHDTWNEKRDADEPKRLREEKNG